MPEKLVDSIQSIMAETVCEHLAYKSGTAYQMNIRLQ